LIRLGLFGFWGTHLASHSGTLWKLPLWLRESLTRNSSSRENELAGPQWKEKKLHSTYGACSWTADCTNTALCPAPDVQQILDINGMCYFLPLNVYHWATVRLCTKYTM